MFRKSLYEQLDNMSYEEQKALYGRIEDQQAYDDSYNAIEIVVEATIAAVKALVKLIF